VEKKNKKAVQTIDRQKEIERLEKDVEELRRLAPGSEDGDAEIERLKQEVLELRREFYTHLGPWQRAQIARHPQRPHTLDWISLMITDFIELHGDRGFGDDKALIAGMGRKREETPSSVSCAISASPSLKAIARPFASCSSLQSSVAPF
jgi:acetyl-CoA carboxylase carboxyl transferase subunit alpha